jgi:hypothetical protein
MENETSINHKNGMKLMCISTSYHHADLLTINKWYEGNLTPLLRSALNRTIYDPQTLQPVPPSYIVRCNDGKYRKVDAEYFLTIEDWREKKLKELEI